MCASSLSSLFAKTLTERTIRAGIVKLLSRESCCLERFGFHWLSWRGRGLPDLMERGSIQADFDNTSDFAVALNNKAGSEVESGKCKVQSEKEPPQSKS